MLIFIAIPGVCLYSAFQTDKTMQTIYERIIFFQEGSLDMDTVLYLARSNWNHYILSTGSTIRMEFVINPNIEKKLALINNSRLFQVQPC